MQCWPDDGKLRACEDDHPSEHTHFQDCFSCRRRYAAAHHCTLCTLNHRQGQSPHRATKGWWTHARHGRRGHGCEIDRKSDNEATSRVVCRYHAARIRQNHAIGVVARQRQLKRYGSTESESPLLDFRLVLVAWNCDQPWVIKLGCPVMPQHVGYCICCIRRV